ncbi:GNAT family N-acetyltransferase [Pukyongiella litopenaei]|uniref:GNAT family N-acetyltransferase n=2 Tax=Pukyongiella litopenaei TaxID=2605946 RepID=A0A2S0MV97_9RHOB|nr:GNAT family N-acetyltransferase [Pukyongiella litopenaei]AVO39830.1 GNAT family N-acetyltransferase [Pukyongiella litopenaei]
MLPCGPFVLRDGQGGGSRVSAATLREPGRDVAADDIEAAETAMRGLGQVPLFMLRDGEDALDAALAGRGYAVKDPVIAWACPVSMLTGTPVPRVTVFALWEPLAIMRELWAAGGIGPDRLAVMDRVQGPRTGLMGRNRDKPAGAAFVAIHGRTAMLHALEIPPFQRRHGMGRWFLRAAGFWAAENGADLLTVVCTRDNAAANALYAALGMAQVGAYHYRIAPPEGKGP